MDAACAVAVLLRIILPLYTYIYIRAAWHHFIVTAQLATSPEAPMCENKLQCYRLTLAVFAVSKCQVRGTVVHGLRFITKRGRGSSGSPAALVTPGGP